MKSWLASSLFFVLFFIPVFSAHAEYVSGYTKANGTYVQGYERSSPDGNPYNNYDYPGNYNPNTGSITGGSATSYLENYYKSSYGDDDYSSYLDTPSCPLDSYYNGSSCSCLSGYVSSGGSCVYGNTLCYAQLGYLSNYNSTSNSCECDAGDVIDSSGQCTSATMYCYDKMGLMSQYNSLTKTCGCMAGYSFNGTSCVYDDTNNYSNLCPANSHINLTNLSTCTCNTGYQVNSTKDACVPSPISTNDQLCQASYGLNSQWNGTTNSNSTINCSCKLGYNWNTGQTDCI